MTPRRVLVTGASGQVGRDLTDVLGGWTPPGADAGWQPDGEAIGEGEFDVFGATHHELDVSDALSLSRALDAVRPDVIVNLAAWTKVDLAQDHIDEASRANTEAVEIVSKACAKRDIHLITVSTDYVFDGRKGAAYEEGDIPNPLNVYGLTKWQGELRCSPDDTIVRTSWVMAGRGRHVAAVVAERVGQGQPVKFVDDQRGTFTNAADLARALATFVRLQPGGLWHFANSGDVTWCELANEVATLCGAPSGFVEAISTAELSPPQRAQRPARSDLAVSKWRSAGLIDPPQWREALKRVIDVR